MERQESRLYEFEDFSLDVAERQLVRQGNVLPLSDKLFDALLVLLENPGHLVDKEEFKKRVWPDTYVDEGTLARNISRLRQVLREQDGGRNFIEVVPKRGYRFKAPVKANVKQRKQPLEKVALQQGLADDAIPPSPKAGERRLSHSLSYRIFRRLKPAQALSVLVPISAAAAISLAYLAFRPGPRRSAAVKKVDPLAYEAYVKGRYFWGKRSYPGYQKSLALFQQAIDRDPNFALAYSGLADANAIGGDWNKAEPLAERALALDPSIGEAHASLGFLKMFWQWNWQDADAHFKKAVELSPNYATGHQWYALSLAYRGRFDEAEAQMRRARELDPVSPAINTDLGQIYYFAGDYDRAQEQALKAIEIEPDFRFAHYLLCDTLDHHGLYAQEVEEAAAESQRELRWGGRFPKTPPTPDSMRQSFRKGGIQAYRGVWLDADLQIGDYYRAARHSMSLGDRQKALHYLELAADAREFEMIYLGVDPAFSSLRHEPAFKQALSRVGLPTGR